MEYTTFASAIQEDYGSAVSDLGSLYRAFERVEDPRRLQGRRYELALVLTLLVFAKLMGETTLSGAVHCLRLRRDWLQAQFGLKRPTIPCHMTFCNILHALDAQQVNHLLADFFVRWEAQSRCGDEPSRLAHLDGKQEHAHIALDGKTMRATTKTGKMTHVMSWYEVHTGIVLAQHVVQAKCNEISAVAHMICPQLVQGRILSADAMHTQRDFCSQVHRFGGTYILIAKDNQLSTKEDIEDLFEDRTPDRRRWNVAETFEKGHGRREWRHITCTPDLNDWFDEQWSGIQQVFRIERRTCIVKTGEIKHDIHYGLSSLSTTQASPERMLRLIRAHWAIENRLHWRRDVTLGEDSCQTRSRRMPEMLSTLNSVVLSLMDRLGVSNVPQQIRIFRADPEQAIKLLLANPCQGL